MSVDVEREIRAYAAYLDEILPTVTADDVRTATVSTPLGPPRTNRSEPSWYRRPVTVFAAAVAVTFVVLGSLILLAPFSEQDAVTVTDPPVVTVPPVVTTTTAAPFVGPVGAFEWEMHELSEFITYPARWSGGYVALRGDWVVSSVDGIKWEEWPEQPADLADRSLAELALVVDDGDVVAVIARSSAPPRAFASNEGRTWRELTFESASFSAYDAAPLAIANVDDGLYVHHWETYRRQGESFVVMPPPDDSTHDRAFWGQETGRSWTGIALPDQKLTVGERDGRFTAFTWPDPGVTWTATDGQRW